MKENKEIYRVPEGFDINRFSSFLTDSIRCSVPTLESERIAAELCKIVERGGCGAVIVGEPRIGKTRSIVLIRSKLKQKFGKDLPVYSFRASEKSTNTDKAFFTEMLLSFGFPAPSRRDTALDMKLRLINAIKMDAERTRYRKVILLLDDAQDIKKKELSLLRDIHDELDWMEARLSLILFGQKVETNMLLNKLRAERQMQIIGRFFTRFFDYHGIQSPQALAFLLLSLDNNVDFMFGDRRIVISRDLFPYSFDKSGFAALTAPLWNAFIETNRTYGISTDEIPMEYMMSTISLIILRYSIAGDGPEAPVGVYPGISEIMECIETSGYRYYAEALAQPAP